MLIRKSGLDKIYIKDNSVIKTIKQIKFNAIEKYKVKDISFIPNPNIGVIDIETYLGKDNTYKVYALGFRTNLIDDPQIYYIGNDFNSDKVVLELIDELLRPKYNNITFYTHNLGGYDAVFLINVLHKYNESHEVGKYIVTNITRDSKVIKLTIKKNENKISILDSYCLLTKSLKNLGRDFEVETQKSIFPYKFSIENHLFYEGSTPEMKFYDNISIEEYDKIYKKY